jgi:hypothetical protein
VKSSAVYVNHYWPGLCEHESVSQRLLVVTAPVRGSTPHNFSKEVDLELREECGQLPRFISKDGSIGSE